MAFRESFHQLLLGRGVCSQFGALNNTCIYCIDYGQVLVKGLEVYPARLVFQKPNFYLKKSKCLIFFYLKIFKLGLLTNIPPNGFFLELLILLKAK